MFIGNYRKLTLTRTPDPIRSTRKVLTLTDPRCGECFENWHQPVGLLVTLCDPRGAVMTLTDPLGRHLKNWH